MVKVFLCGDKNDQSIKNALIRAVNNYGNFSIHEDDNLSTIKENYDILIFKNSFKYQKCKLNKQSLYITDSQNKNAISVLKENSLAAVTCGMNFKDTVSISSLNSEQATVSLQRNIVTCDGNIIEPRDVKITLKKKTSIYPLLTSTIVLLVSSSEPKNNYVF